MSPATTVDALGATHRGQCQEGAVDGIGVEVVVDASAHDDLGAALGIRGILCKLAANADGGIRRNAGKFFLPGRGADLAGVVEVLRP